MIIDNLINKGNEILKEEGILSYRIDSELLLSKIIKKDRAFILTNGDHIVSFKEAKDYLKIISRRRKREPLAYITKTKEFWSLDYNVNNDVLIPRPESEIIVDQVIKKFKYKNNTSILDIGTGSGCILLSIIKELKTSSGVGIDKSLEAVNIASRNSKILNLMGRTKFINCDVDNFDFGNYDVIVSNPPYVCTHRMKYLSKDIRDFEPRMALDGGNSGLEIINKVIIKAKKLLKANGCLFIEIGNDQQQKVSSLLLNKGFKLVEKFLDYSKIVRCIMSTKTI